MSAEITIYGHPFSSYTWKVLIACRERGLDYEFAEVGPDHPQNNELVQRANPMGQFPVLKHDGRIVIESDVITEYLDVAFPEAGAPLIPTDRLLAIEARQMSAVFDDYVQNHQGKLVLDALRPEDDRDPHGVKTARAALQRVYRWLDGWMEGKIWAASGAFSIADCSAAPALFYAHWAEPIPEELTHLRDYRRRLLERPSIASVVDDARYFRP